MEPLGIAEPLMERGQTTPPAELAAAKPLLGARISLLATIGAVWGPGLLVMLADTDAGNVVTAAQAGSVWGFRLAPVLLLLIPVLILVQDLAVRIGIYRNCGFGDLIRENFGRPGACVAAAALIAATLGSLVTEFTGIAGVGELYGASRWIILPLASATLIVVAFTGAYRRVERIALVFGLFEVAFLFVAWRSHPAASEIVRDVADQKLNDTGYLYLAAGLIGATFNPWMIFYQASAISEKRLTSDDYGAARWETVFGAILTQILTTAVLVAVAALKSGVTGQSLVSIGQISQALTPLLGETTGRLVFSAGVVGAAMAAAIVCSLACAWGLGELFGLRHSLEREARHSLGVLSIYSAWVLGSAALVLFVSDLVWLSVGMQVLNAVLLPIVVSLLVIIAATILPQSVRIAGWRLWLTVGLVGAVSAAGLVGAAAGLWQ
jgi:Mn2+/Fe2+ NRAMP family transporter